MPIHDSFPRNNRFLSSALIQPDAQAAAELANRDLPRARILANRVSLPTAGLYAELFVALSALAQQNTSPAFVRVKGMRWKTLVR